MRDFCIFEDTPRLFLLGNRQFTFIAHNLDVAEDVIVLVEVSRRAFNLLLDVAGGFFLFMLLAVHQQQNIVEQRCNIVLVPIAAQLHS